MPLLNLGLQISVPFEKVGVATASRQFFQQLGSTAGSAVLGAVLTSTLTASLEANLAPIRKKLPTEVAAQFDVSAMKHGGPRQEGGGESLSIGQRMEAGVHARFEAQRSVFRKGLLEDDPAAMHALRTDVRLPKEFQAMVEPGALEAVVERQAQARLKVLDEAARAHDVASWKSIADDPATPPAVHDTLTQVDLASLKDDAARAAFLESLKPGIAEGKPLMMKAANERLYKRAMEGIDAVEKGAVVEAINTGEELDGAVKKSFAHSVTTIYRMSVPLVLLALLLMFFVKELPLRKTNLAPAPAAEGGA